MAGRVTVIIGAGGVLDFDFKGHTIPSTQNLTKAIIEQPVQRFETGKTDLYLIKEVYDEVVKTAKSKYEEFHPDVRNYKPCINFEDIFEVLETLSSHARINDLGTKYPASACFFNIKTEHKHMSVEYDRTLIVSLKTILNIVNEYSTSFVNDTASESWYRVFWQAFNNHADIFNLNYDTTIETSLEDNFEDGFIPFCPEYKKFSPRDLICNPRQLSTVNHLHGCILYGDANPAVGQYEYSHRDLYKYTTYSPKNISYQTTPTNQAEVTIYYTPIITGHRKTDKICYLPHSYYHANLANKILENPGLLIIGYSFNDIYVNQLIERHKLIHGQNQRITVIDKYPEYTDSHEVLRHQDIIKKDSIGHFGFITRCLENYIPYLALRTLHKKAPFFWGNEKGTFRLYTSGFKDAVQRYSNDIMLFLNVNG